MAAATAVAALGNTASSSSTAGLQILGNYLGNAQNLANQQTLMSHVENTFKESGLPRYMAYTGTGDMPQNRYQVSGGNFYSAGPVNSNLPTFTTQAQQDTHSGRPGRPYEAVPPFNQLGPNNEMRVLGQNDRQGLGFGRYNIQNNFVAGGVMTAATPRNAAAHQAAARILQ